MSNIIEIKDLLDERLDVYARLNEAQLLHFEEEENGIFIAESPKVVERALDAGYEPVSFLLEQKHVEGEARELLARCPETPVFTAEPELLAQITGFQLTRGVLCAMKRKVLPTVEEVCAGAKRIVVLENVVNPTNVGAIVRSAAALHMDAVLLTPYSCDPLYRRAIRVSMGTVFQIPWTFLGTRKRGEKPEGCAMDKLKGLGFKTVSMALRNNSVDINDPVLGKEERLAILMGTEGEGLLPETIANSDYTVKIPMAHGVDSLNVAAASAVAFWQLGIHDALKQTERR